MLVRESLAEFLERLADRYYGHEIVAILEDAGILSVEQLLELIEDYVIEGKNRFEL